MAPVLDVKDLKVSFFTLEGEVKAVDGVSYSVEEGEFVVMVGESGSGKSVSAMALMSLIQSPGRILGGEVLLEGQSILGLDEKAIRSVRGLRIGMVFQEPMTSLNPVFTIGFQLMEPLRLQLGMDRGAANNRAIELLTMVGISDAPLRMAQYPYQLSGGMRQRVMVAIAMSCGPKLLIADEPTTALDVTIQAQVLDLIKDVSVRTGTSVVLITHNLGVVARYADRLNIMYAGKIVESGTAQEVFEAPRHPYTIGLLNSVPRLIGQEARLRPIMGAPPNLARLHRGCAFQPRCEYAVERCGTEVPPLATVPLFFPDDGDSAHLSACWVSDTLSPQIAEPGKESE